MLAATQINTREGFGSLGVYFETIFFLAMTKPASSDRQESIILIPGKAEYSRKVQAELYGKINSKLSLILSSGRGMLQKCSSKESAIVWLH